MKNICPLWGGRLRSRPPLQQLLFVHLFFMTENIYPIMPLNHQSIIEGVQDCKPNVTK